jgi:hypothetical protein
MTDRDGRISSRWQRAGMAQIGADRRIHDVRESVRSFTHVRYLCGVSFSLAL